MDFMDFTDFQTLIPIFFISIEAFNWTDAGSQLIIEE